MNKVLILIMSCRAQFFKNEVHRIMMTWGSHLPKNMQIAYYDGGWDNPGIETDEDGVMHVMSTASDTLEYTYAKTYDALRILMCSDTFDFDWVFRVNTSTWVNTALLRKFVDTNPKTDTLYASELYSLTEACVPEPLGLYARGNAFLMHKDLVGILLNEGISLLYMKIVDDVAIGNVINTYYIKTSHSFSSYINHLKGLPHGWFRCVRTNADNGHRLCRYGEDGDQAFYNRMMTVQLKMYRNREQEPQNMDDFWQMMKDAPEPSLDCLKEYMKNPSVFIGSACGYIDYNDWLRCDKKALYEYEMRNKASDDKQSKNFKQELYDALHHVPGINPKK